MSTHLYLASSQSEKAKLGADPAGITVVLADDHERVRRSLRLLLDREDDVDVVAEAADLDTVARHVHGHAPHVLVLDLEMPGGSSIAAIGRLRERVPETEIVVLTMERSPPLLRAIEAGAVGFVMKDRADTELPDAVRRAARGEEYVSPLVAAGLEPLRRTIDGDGLTPREAEVLRFMRELIGG